MSAKINQIVDGIKSFLSHLQVKLAQETGHEIERYLEEEVTRRLYRQPHERRTRVKCQGQAECQRCGSRQVSDFMRNGRRKRQVVTRQGVIEFWLPRVKCQCGGSVTIPFAILKPYQQIWDDVVIQVDRWANLGLSLRQMQTEIGEQVGTQVGLRTLNTIVQTVHNPAAIELSSVPPVVMLDAIWVTLLENTDHKQLDSHQRLRTVKIRRKVCVLVALGLYPQTGKWGILGWQIASDESQPAWETLLQPLENRGLYQENGVELLIHDGGKGLIAALNYLYPHIPHQRCAFHKLRNLWHNIQTPKDLTSQQRIHLKQQVLQPVQAILYADDEQQATQLRDTICHMFDKTQPAFVATLQRDWQETVAFYRVLKRFPKWSRTALRTTSLLERVNRMLRRLIRPKAAFHSYSGLYATVARVLNPKRLT